MTPEKTDFNPTFRIKVWCKFDQTLTRLLDIDKNIHLFKNASCFIFNLFLLWLQHHLQWISTVYSPKSSSTVCIYFLFIDLRNRHWHLLDRKQWRRQWSWSEEATGVTSKNCVSTLDCRGSSDLMNCFATSKNMLHHQVCCCVLLWVHVFHELILYILNLQWKKNVVFYDLLMFY